MIIFNLQMKTSSQKYRTLFGSSRFFFSNIWLKSLYYSRFWKQTCWIKATRGGVINSTNMGGSFPKISSTHGPPSWNPKSGRIQTAEADDPRFKVGKTGGTLMMIFCAEIWSDYLEGSCWILLNIYSFVTIIQRKTWWISNAFHFLHLRSKLMRTWRPGYFELQNVWSLKVGFHSSMWVGCSGCFVWLVGVDAEITRILRWWDFTCGNVGRVRVVAFSILQKKGFCLIIYAWCSNCLVRIHLLLVIFGVFLQIPPGLEHNLFDSIACWILHKLKRRFRFLIGQRHGGEKKIGFNDAKKQQMICLDVSQWHAIKSCHVLSYLQGGPLPVTNRFKTPYE